MDLRAALGPMLGAGLLELAAVRLGSYGWFSLATPYYLVLLLRGDALAALTLCSAASLARALGFSAGTTPRRAREVLAEVVPLALTATAWAVLSRYAQGWLLTLSCVQIYLVAAWFIPRALARQVLSGDESEMLIQVYDRLAPIHLATSCAGLLLAHYRGDPLWLLLAAPGLLVLRPAVNAALSRADRWQQQRLKRSLSRAEQARDTAREATARVQEELTRKVDQVALLEGLARSLAQNPDPFQTVVNLLEVARQLVPAQTQAFFGPEGNQLLPLRYFSPQAERLASARLLAVREPVVEQAWRTGEVAHTLPDPRPQERLLPGEVAVAIPFGPLGVLYVGDALRTSYEPEEVESLRTLAAQGAPLLQSAHYFRRLDQSLSQHAQANEHLQVWAQGLGRVLEGAQLLTSHLDEDELNGRLRSSVATLAPHDFYWLVPRDRCRTDAEGDAGRMLEVARHVLDSGQPLLFEDLQGTRFAPPSGQVRSLLAVPLAHPEGIFAVLLVGDAAPGRYGRQQQDLLAVLAYLAGSALQNAMTHRQVTEAYQQLRDSQAQLVQSSKLAAVGQLAAGVAHELNTPLGAIEISVESALANLEKNNVPRAQLRLERAGIGLAKAKTIVNKLLFYSREGKRERQPFDLNRVVQDTLDLLSHHMKLDAIEVTFSAGELPQLEGNQSEVQQVVMNLLINARDAVKEPGAQGRVVKVVTAAENGAVRLDVQDTGPGLAPELQARIFEPFFTTKEVGKGTGLGLSLSREIVARHEGSLMVTSTPGQGACFSMLLPLDDSPVTLRPV